MQLTIHTIDVEQGESALVVAADVTAGRHRTILIEGGLLGYAETVQNFIDPILRGYVYSLDHVLVSHYDKDHSGEVIGLLNADNMRVVSEAISNSVAKAAQWAAAGTRPQQIACGAVAASATILGACSRNVNQILAMCQAVFPRAAGKTDDEAAELGFNYALEHTNKVQGFPALEVGKTGRRRNIAKISAVAAAIAIASGNNPAAAAFGAIFLLIAKTLPNQLRLDTGRYCNVHIIDIEQPIWPSHAVGVYADRALGQHITKDEIFRNSGTSTTLPSPHSPGIFCRVISFWVWQGMGSNPVQTVWRRKAGDCKSNLVRICERIISSLRAIF
ncbi:hypothetical protein [Nitrosovibrio sp. Nv6]|uniref:hypothetical protein n=1 Tax=Nitrosovibrio sp. Nv6 TaxID=1855340 RepID=UPI0008BDB27E|nr:hypothetical protein [Nitrosovibrio sp. Nv6]SEP38503.1 hypothetical protein SAMN05216316_2713 [Nitrosovibrio sp. Nv6]